MVVQEPVPTQVLDLQIGLSNYGSYGIGRDDGKDHGEYSAIFYRLDRYELLDQDTLWLSETPDRSGSKGWNASLPRICSWIKAGDRFNNKDIYYFNTHLDHRGRNAQRESASLILSLIQRIAGDSMATIVTGDFNVAPQSDPYRIMVTNTIFQDAKLLSETSHLGPDGTFSTFDTKYEIGDRIDYIFITSSFFRVLKHSHLTDSDNQYYPSDHLPVLASSLNRLAKYMFVI